MRRLEVSRANQDTGKAFREIFGKLKAEEDPFFQRKGRAGEVFQERLSELCLREQDR